MTISFWLYVHIHTCAKSISTLGDWHVLFCINLRMIIRISGLIDIPTVKNCQATSIPLAYTLIVF